MVYFPINADSWLQILTFHTEDNDDEQQDQADYWEEYTHSSVQTCASHCLFAYREMISWMLVSSCNEQHKPPSRLKNENALTYLFPPPVQQTSWTPVTILHRLHLFYPHHNCDKIWCTWWKMSWDFVRSLLVCPALSACLKFKDAQPPTPPALVSLP